MFCKICGKDIMGGNKCMYCGHVHDGSVGVPNHTVGARGKEVSPETVSSLVNKLLVKGNNKTSGNPFALASVIMFVIAVIAVALIGWCVSMWHSSFGEAMYFWVPMIYTASGIGIALAVIGLIESKHNNWGSNLAFVSLILNSLLCFVFLFIH